MVVEGEIETTLSHTSFSCKPSDTHGIAICDKDACELSMDIVDTVGMGFGTGIGTDDNDVDDDDVDVDDDDGDADEG